MDAARLLHKLSLTGSSAGLAQYTVDAGPDEDVAQANSPARLEKALAAIDPRDFAEAMNLPSAWEIGSNAYAVGAEAAQGNAGILLGNPHFSWQGAQRFFHVPVDGG